ncbi:hypothetical protein M3G50_07375 [Brachybacterium muris]|uniref:hypothetical protein n=1 Tax=Brachybacterium muris TaxID=219301 RepID=UPI0021A29000|nr:hypothetical protein [Brachybacterium muris]MCT1430573.1 hypothetical protein [Brachybacterium muris]
MHYTRQQMLARTGSLAFVEEPAAPEGGGEPQEPQEGAEGQGEGGDDDSGESQEDESSAPLDQEATIAALRKARDQAAKYRQRTHEAEKKAEGASKETEAQASEILRLRVALKHGLPEALVGRLNGSTEEELLADAEDLMGLFVAKEPPSQSPKRKAPLRTPGSAEDGVDIDKLALSQLAE